MKLIRGVAGGCLIAGILVLGQNAGAVVMGDGNYVGQVVNGAPANAVSEVGYINFLITLDTGAGFPVAVDNPALGDDEMYDRIDSTIDPAPLEPLPGGFPAATTAGGQNGLGASATIDASGFQYLLAKYGGFTWVWYSETGFSATEAVPQSKLSHISLYNGISVPDAGASLVLFGAGLVGIGLVRRRVSK